MDNFESNNLRKEILNSLKPLSSNNHDYLNRFWLYYFLMKNRELDKNQIGEIRNFLFDCEIPRRDWQFLDDDITAFLLGYKILSEINENEKFIDKAITVKKELENHWNENSKTYFNNDLLTLLVLLADTQNTHLNDILYKFKDIKDCKLISMLFSALEMQKNDLKPLYISFVERIEKNYYSVPDSEKIYAAWILWKYKYLSKSKIKFIRKTVSSYLSMVNWIMEEIKNKKLDYSVTLYYDLISDFNKNTRLALEEVPISYRLLGYTSGFLSLVLILNIDLILWNMGYLHPDILGLTNKFLNYVIFAISGFIIVISAFSIVQIGIKGIYTDRLIKNGIIKLLKWYFLTVVVAALIIRTIVSFLV